jgi:DNA-binding NarL/FixJ family response regulator
METIRVLIADDHPHFRDGLRALLVSAPDLDVVGEAGDGEQAISLATELQPDVILMDINMPGGGGIEATRRILRTSPHIAILVISMFEDDDSVFAALIAQHETNPEIAKRLYLSPKTVRNHVSNIFTKLQVSDRAQAIIRAREAGLGQDRM